MRSFFLVLLFFVSCSNTVKLSQDIEFSDEESFDEKRVLTDLKVEENPENVLSCRLTFKTDKKVSTLIRYHSDTYSRYELTDENKGDHYFFIWGMRAETKYTIEIFFLDEDEPVVTTEFVTGKLPESVPPIILRKKDGQKVSEGFVLFTYYYIPEDQSKPIVMMLDSEGKTVVYGLELYLEVMFIILKRPQRY